MKKVFTKSFGMYTIEEENSLKEIAKENLEENGYSEKEIEERIEEEMFQLALYYNEGEIENLKFAMEDKEYRIEGTLGLWDGRHTIIPVIRKGIDAVLDCLNESDDYVIYEERGTLKVVAYHHDGRNEFTLKEKTPKGFRSPNLWKRLYL